MFGRLRRSWNTPTNSPAVTRVEIAEERDRAAEVADAQGRLPKPSAPSQLWVDFFGVIATRSLQGLLVLAAASILVWALLQVSIVVVPMLLAMIIAAAFAPVLDWLGRYGWPRAVSTVVVLLAAVIVLSGMVAIVVAQVLGQWHDLATTAGQGVTQTIDWWNATFPQFSLTQQRLDDLGGTLQSLLSSINFGVLGSGLASGLSVFGSLATSTVLFAVILFFFLKDGPRIWYFLIRPLPTRQHRRAELMGARAVGVMGGYVRGTVIVAFVDAVFIGLGMLILGVPLWLPLALVVFICAFIPVVGATLAGIIAALVTLVTNGTVSALVVVVIVVVVNQLEGNLLQPIVLGRSLKLHELVVLLALTIGTVLGGIVGTLISVPLTAVAWALIKAWNESLPDLEATEHEDSLRERLRERWRRADRNPQRMRGARR